jgi:Flp pilus assembly protein TadB
VQPLTIGSWQPGETAKEAIQGLIDIGKFLITALIWIVIVLLPVLAIVYLVFFLPLRWIWRKIRKPRQSRISEPTGEPTIPPTA